MDQLLEQLRDRLSISLSADSWEGFLRVTLSLDDQEVASDSISLSEIAPYFRRD
jgi:hypothetical protein